jgi:hypothetical protein
VTDGRGARPLGPGTGERSTSGPEWIPGGWSNQEGSFFPIDVATVTDPQDQDQQHAFADLIDHPIRSDPDSVLVVRPFELLRPGGLSVAGQCVDLGARRNCASRRSFRSCLRAPFANSI